MKTQDYINFKPFEKALNSAKSTNYVRFSGKEFNVFSDAVKEWRGTAVTPSERTCMHCCLRLVKQIAEEYFRFKSSPAGKKIDKGQDGEEEC